ARLDGALVAAVDFEIVGHGSLLTDVAVRLHENRACSIAEVGSTRRQLLERGEARFERGHVLLARAYIAREALVLAARGAKLRLPRRKIQPDHFEGAASASQRIDGRRAIRAHTLVLATMIVLLD